MTASNDYHFVTVWEIEGTCEEVTEVLGDASGLARWWPSVYLAVRELEPGDEHALGRVVDLYTKGWLPYTLRWQLRVVSSDPPHGFAIEASGDFVGRGAWTLEQAGAHTRVTYDWRILAEKGILRTFSFVLRRLFSANHRWAMARGEQSLRLELARRRARTPEELAAIPAPPGPTFPHNLRRRTAPA